MRLCWNDWFYLRPLGEATLEEARLIRDMGFRVAGINCNYPHRASDADIDHVKNIFADAGLMPGLYAGVPENPVTEFPAFREQATKALKIAAKLGCISLRYAVGSFSQKSGFHPHPENHTEKAMDTLVKNIREVVPVAEDTGVMLCPETTQWTIVNSVETMKEYVDQVGSPYSKIIFDPVNHMTYDRIYESGRYMKCAIETLGDRIGVIHVKDVRIDETIIPVVGIREEKMGEGLLDHEALIKASAKLAGWKTFSLEHIGLDYKDPETVKKVKEAHDYIQGVADHIGHKWTNPKCTREKWENGECE